MQQVAGTDACPGGNDPRQLIRRIIASLKHDFLDLNSVASVILLTNKSNSNNKNKRPGTPPKFRPATRDPGPGPRPAARGLRPAAPRPADYGPRPRGPAAPRPAAVATDLQSSPFFDFWAQNTRFVKDVHVFKVKNTTNTSYRGRPAIRAFTFLYTFTFLHLYRRKVTTPGALRLPPPSPFR